MYDVIIIGGGVAGLTSAIYLLRANKKVLIIEKETIGGQITSSPLVENYPGFLSISGMDIADNLYNQVINLGADIELEEVLSLELETTIKKVVTDYNKYEAKVIIIATGAKYITTGVEDDYIGRGVNFCVACDGAFYKDKEVAVIGGGNTAVINSIALADIAKKIYLITCDDFLTGEVKNIEKVNRLDNVDIMYNTKMTKVIGDNDVEKIELSSLDKTTSLDVDGMFIAVGMKPNINLIKDKLKLDDRGYILSSDSNTIYDGVFVAGDCRSKEVRQLTTATSDGTIAATLAIKYLSK